MVVGLVAIHEHHRPLAIGALDGVSRDQHISSGIVDIARGLELLVWCVDRLHPFFGDDQRRHILRRIADYLVALVDQKKRISAVVDGIRHVMEIVGSTRAFAHHGADIICQP